MIARPHGGTVAARAVARALAIALVGLVVTAPVTAAQEKKADDAPPSCPPESTPDPILKVEVVSNPDAPPPLAPVERADDLRWKATGSVYFLPEVTWADVNVRRQLGTFGTWIGVFHDPNTETIGRVGLEWDYRRGPLLVVPSGQVATNGLVAGQVYSEFGHQTYLIAGLSRTNLEPFYNLSWDPNESVQLGLGHRVNRYDKLYAFTIFDVRLHTGQQDTHVLYRHRLTPKLGVTVDGLYKSGRDDSGRWVSAVGIGFYVDGTRWLAKAYYDPHANFSDDTMFRFALGAKL